LQDAIPLAVYLSAIHSDGFTIHPQWRSATNNFHHQPRSRENLMFGYASWSHPANIFENPKESIMLPKASIMFFTDPLDTEISVESNTSVFSTGLISTLKQRMSDCCYWPARAPFGLYQNLQFAKPNG
jgi:hypothetical protein